jgi:hypothetical protein
MIVSPSGQAIKLDGCEPEARGSGVAPEGDCQQTQGSDRYSSADPGRL